MLVLLFLVRFLWLGVDPAFHFVGHGQGQLTDPYQFTSHARNAILYDDSHPFDFHRWDVFKNSLVSGTGYLTFSLFGVSRVSANFVGALLSTFGILFFLLALWKTAGRTETIIAALLLLVNSTLFFYGRMPFLENGLIFFSGLLFMVVVLYIDRWWGQLLSGLVVALAVLAGKLFGLCLIAPVGLVLLYKYRRRSTIPITIAIAGFAFGVTAFIMTFYGGDLSILLNYSTEQTIGMYGSPPGFNSVVNFIKMLITFGGESGLWQYLPFLLILLILSSIVILLSNRRRTEEQHDNLPLIFCIGWLVAGILIFMPFLYRPLRYTTFLFLPMSALIAYAVSVARSKRLYLSINNKWTVLPVLFSILWYGIDQGVILFAKQGTKFLAGAQALSMAAFAAGVVTAIVSSLLWSRRRAMPRTTMVFLFVALFLAHGTVQGYRIAQGIRQPGNYLEQFSRELAEIIDSEAILSGPFAPTLTTDNELHSIIYMFGLSNVQTDLFERFGITHILTDETNWKMAQVSFPQMKSAWRVVQMAIREEVISLYRLSEASVPMSDFERGVSFRQQKQGDSALVYLKKFCDTHKANTLSRMQLALAYLTTGDYDNAIATLDSLLSAYPENYTILGFTQGFYLNVHRVTGNIEYLRLSEYYKQKAKKLNPYAALGR